MLECLMEFLGDEKNDLCCSEFRRLEGNGREILGKPERTCFAGRGRTGASSGDSSLWVTRKWKWGGVVAGAREREEFLGDSG